MSRFFIRWTTFATAGIAAVVCSTLAIPVQAATLTYGGVLNYSDSSCAAFVPTVNGNDVTITCGAAPPPPPGAPTNCRASISTNPSPLTSAGGTATPSVTCDAPPVGSVITYSWTKGGAAFSCSTSTCSADPLPANTTASNQAYSYKPTPCIGTACANVAAVTATVPGSGGGGGGGGGAIDCSAAGYARTITIDLTWGAPRRMFTADGGGFFPTDAVVLRFTTGAATSPDNLGSVHGVEYQAVSSVRHGTLSTQACDFGKGLFPPYSDVKSISPQLYFTVGGSSFHGYPVLQPNTTYYVNLYNVQPAGCAANANCNMSFDLSKPSGL